MRGYVESDPGVSGRVEKDVFGKGLGGVGFRCGGGAGEMREARDRVVRVADDLEVVIRINGADWIGVILVNLVMTGHGDIRQGRIEMRISDIGIVINTSHDSSAMLCSL